MKERFRAKFIGMAWALVMLSACAQEPSEQESGISGSTTEPAQEQQAAVRMDCRDEVAAAFERMKTSGRPYRTETTATVDGRTFQEIIEFVPPDQMRLSDNHAWIITEYYIRIGQRAWANWSPFPWGWNEEYPDLRFQQMKLKTSNDIVATLNFRPPVYECLGRVEFEGTAYLGYRSRVQIQKLVAATGPDGSTLSETRKRELVREFEQMPKEWRTVFVDPQSALPVYELVAQENQLGNPSSTVRFTYPSNIDIKPPLWCRLGLCGSVPWGR